MPKIAELEETIGYTFRDKELLEQALTHSSMHKSYAFERLEFLGDRIVGMVIAEWLFRKCPKDPEGALAKRQAHLISRYALQHIAQQICLGRFLHIQGSDYTTKHSANVLSDAMEALVASVFLDGGWKNVRALIIRLWAPLCDQQGPGTTPFIDPKSALQEYLQAFKRSLPHYTVVSEQGPVHQPVFVVCAQLDDGESFHAEGKSKREAEKNAARAALRELLKKDKE